MLKKRTRASRSRTQFAPIAMARCVLPEPVPPISTALRLSDNQDNADHLNKLEFGR